MRIKTSVPTTARLMAVLHLNAARAALAQAKVYPADKAFARHHLAKARAYTALRALGW